MKGIIGTLIFGQRDKMPLEDMALTVVHFKHWTATAQLIAALRDYARECGFSDARLP